MPILDRMETWFALRGESCLPNAWKSGGSADYARVLVLMLMATAPIFFLSSLEHWLVYHHAPSALTLLCGGAATIALLVSVRFIPNPHLAGVLLATTVWVTIFFVSYFRGGFDLSIQLWNLALPLAALALGRPGSAAHLTGLVAVQVVALFALERLGATPPRIETSGLVEVVVVCAWLGFLVWTFRRISKFNARITGHADQVQQQGLEAVGLLAGGVAHDFGNTLAVVMGHAEAALHNPNVSPDTAKDLRAILAAARHGKSLSCQLLNLSKDATVVSTVVDLPRAVRELHEMLQRLLPREVEILLDADDQACLVLADRGRIYRVLLNLALNARDALQGEGRLTLGCYQLSVDEPITAAPDIIPAGDWAVIEVTDTGAGMPPETLARMFDPFFTTKGSTHGTGLGLSNVRTLVGRLHGRIGVWSEPGQGTTVRLLFPRVELEQTADTAESIAAPVVGPALGPRRAKRLLVVDDEVPVRKAMCRLLRSSGFDCVVAGTGQQALDLLREGAGVDAIITDVSMPEMGGEEFADRLAREHPGLGVVFVSGRAEQHEPPKRLRSRSLTKPFERAELLAAIEWVAEEEEGSVSTGLPSASLQ